MTSVLKIKSLSKHFGGLSAVLDINIEVKEGSLVGLIGPNGAGKTTLFNLITGVYTPSEGSIELLVKDQFQEISNLKPYQITKLGIARTFQNIRLFRDLSVIENVKIAMNKDIRYGVFSSILRLPKYYRVEAEVEQKAKELLELIGLDKKASELAKNLPYGEQRKLEIARALATSPKILFLDEPAAGMNPHETNDLTGLIQKIKNEIGITIILIEHDMSLVMKICEEVYVLDYGRCIASGIPEEIRKNKRVIEAYLGEGV